jgi:hypothetical protein
MQSAFNAPNSLPSITNLVDAQSWHASGFYGAANLDHLLPLHKLRKKRW